MLTGVQPARGVAAIGAVVAVGAGAFAGLAFAGGETRLERTRIDFEILDGATRTQDQVSMTIEVVDAAKQASIPGFSFAYEFQAATGTAVGTMGACTQPYFRVTAENQSEQTLKLRSSASGSSDEVIVALDDDQGSTLTATRRQEVLTNLSAAIHSSARKLAVDPVQAEADLVEKSTQMVAGLKFLTDDATILPGRKASFLVCFDYVPGVYIQEEEYKWFAGRSDLTLGIYDVPVLRDASGIAQKKTNFQYKLKVHEYKDSMLYQLGAPPQILGTAQIR